MIALAACLALANCGPSPTPPSANEPAPSVSTADAKPSTIGACVDTTVVATGPRLEGVPDSGSTIQYANGMSQVDYAAVPGIDHSQAGDTVRLCLVSIPDNCPPGDDRGRVYAATNQRTGESWSAPDSQHACGGA